MVNALENNQSATRNPDIAVTYPVCKQNDAYRNVFLRYMLEQKYGIDPG